MKLTLIRHTPVLTEPGTCYGWTDVALAPTFDADAATVRGRLGFVPRVVFTSPAERCRRLAHALGGEEVRIDERLRELNFGAWENRRWDDIPRAELDEWGADFVEKSPPRGESFRTLADRVAAFREDFHTEDAAIVTHAGVIRAWLCLDEGRPLREAFERSIDYGECIRVGRPLGNRGGEFRYW